MIRLTPTFTHQAHRTRSRLRIVPLCGLLGASFILSACGVKGSLKTPPPLWGDKKPEQTQTKPSASVYPNEIKAKKRGSNI